MRFGYSELNANTSTVSRQAMFFTFAFFMSAISIPLTGWGMTPLVVVTVWYWTHTIWEWAYHRQVRGRGNLDEEAKLLFDRYGHK